MHLEGSWVISLKNNKLQCVEQNRLTTILSNASGFLYYVTVTGITGQNSANIEDLKKSINTIKSSTKLPIVAGFGIKNKNDVEQISTFTDGVVVGSSIVNIIKDNLNDKNKVEKSIRNIPNVKVTDVNHFSAFDMVKFKKVVFTESSVKELEKRYT